MAVTPTVLADIDDIAKNYYKDVWQPQMAKSKPLKAQFEQLEDWDFAGRKIIFGVKLQTGGGISNAGANKTLPANADGTYDQGEITLKRTYGRMALDAFLMEITKAKHGSYRPAVEEKMDDRMQALDNEINRQMYSAADGKLALTATGAASATQTLSSAYGVTNGGNPIKFVFPGDVLAFYDNAGVIIDRRTVLSKTGTLGAATGTVTLSSTITSVSAGWVAKATADDDNYITGEYNGLLAGMVQSGTFEAIPIGSTWQAIRIHNSGTLQDITDGLMGTLFNSVHANSEEFPNLIVAQPGIIQKYSEIFLPIRRIDGQDTQLKGGYKPVATYQHAGGTSPILGDVACPGNRVFAINTTFIKKLDLIGQQWAAFDGAQFSRITDKDAAEGYVRKYGNLAWTRLNVHGVLEDLTGVSTVDRLFS